MLTNHEIRTVASSGSTDCSREFPIPTPRPYGLPYNLGDVVSCEKIGETILPDKKKSGS